jgi:hypothetical protein
MQVIRGGDMQVAKRTYVDIAMLIEPSETLERCFDIFCRYIPNFLCFENANEPPVAIAIVHQDEAVALYNTSLALDGCGEAM